MIVLVIICIFAKKKNMKEAKTIDEQISLLKQRGMVISNSEKASEVLLDIGFYRFGFYTFPFEMSFPSLEKRSHKLLNGTTFEDVIGLYYFDYDLRKILMNYLNRIEVNLRTYITYYCSIKHKNNNIWFADDKIVTRSYVASFDESVYKTIRKNPVIIRHHNKYPNDRYAPAWKTLEFMTLGNIIALFESIRDNAIKREVANHYGCTLEVFFNYINTIRVIRNACAHGACIYNTFLPKRILSKGPASISMEDCSNIKGVINVIKYMLSRISSNREKDMCAEIESLVSNCGKCTLNLVVKKCIQIF